MNSLLCTNATIVARLDPQYVGFTIKVISHLFAQIGIPLDRVYKLAELINRTGSSPLSRIAPAATSTLLIDSLTRSASKSAWLARPGRSRGFCRTTQPNQAILPSEVRPEHA